MSRQREIIRRAAEIFERKGYADTTIEEIAEAVGIKREAIYYYFKNKAQILTAVIRPQSVSLLDGIKDILALQISSREKLLLALQNHLDRFNPSFLEMSVIARDHQFFESLPEFNELSKIWRGYSQSWINLVTEGQESGQFIGDLNPKVVAFGILGMCNWLSRWYNPAKSVTAREIVRVYFQMVGGGLIKDFAANAATLPISVEDSVMSLPTPSKRDGRKAPAAAEPKRRGRPKVKTAV